LRYPRKNKEYSNFQNVFKIVMGNKKKKIILIMIIQILLSLLDLVGIVLVGIVASISATGYRTRSPNEELNQIFSQFHIVNATLSSQVIILGLIATFVLTGKTILSIVFTRKILIFFGERGATLSYNLIRSLLDKKLSFVISKRSQELVFSLTHGVESLTLQVVATFVVIIADFSLLIMILLALIFFNPLLSILSFGIFLSLGLLLYGSLHRKSAFLGTRYTMLDIQSKETIVEVIKTYREAVVRNTRKSYALRIQDLRIQTSRSSAELAFLPYISKYVMEISVIFGAIIIGTATLFLKDSTTAIATLAIFLVAASRLMPSILRINQGLLQMKASLGTASPTLNLISEFDLTSNADLELQDETVDYFSHLENKALKIQLAGVDFSYPESLNSAISGLSFEIASGSFTAIVGPSGSGKTTLIDLILGILSPNSGLIKIGDLEPLKMINDYPGAIGYVPQEVHIMNGSLRENICLGFKPNQFSDEYLNKVLRDSSLSELVSTMPDGMDTQIGDNGFGLSGGEKQRLGIARALLTKPTLLILDEATSSLDSQTETQIMETISKFKGEKTLIVIAHRLSTIYNSDNLIYLENGSVKAIGSFEHVKQLSPNFAHQASLMGL
jgi:ABC-type multidrug transport system fused ATPase/permease subunit